MYQIFRVIIFICGISIHSTYSVFTDDFNEFLNETYGEDLRRNLERFDMGPGMIGSFGGKVNRNDTLNKRPVIFIHGALFTAGFYVSHYDFFRNQGYLPQELYATTYDSGFATGLLEVPITCSEFKQIRNFIEAVYNYTGSKVDIIAFSLGVLISRKAILGGKCLDNGEQLGEKITHMVETFVAVGGVAYGFQNCDRRRTACNDISSMYCDSKLLRELNSQLNRYEGSYTYAIFSLDDEILGIHCCDHLCAQLRHAVFSIGFPDLDHLSIPAITKYLQLVCLGHPSIDDIRSSARMFTDGIEILTD